MFQSGTINGHLDTKLHRNITTNSVILYGSEKTLVKQKVSSRERDAGIKRWKYFAINK